MKKSRKLRKIENLYEHNNRQSYLKHLKEYEKDPISQYRRDLYIEKRMARSSYADYRQEDRK